MTFIPIQTLRRPRPDRADELTELRRQLRTVETVLELAHHTRDDCTAKIARLEPQRQALRNRINTLEHEPQPTWDRAGGNQELD